MKHIIQPDELPATITVNTGGTSPILLLCEHAGNVIPKTLGSLGLKPDDLTRHIAWDIGAEQVSRRLSKLLDAPLVLQRYSRLVQDCNRPPDHAGAMPEISENTVIPGNGNLSPQDRAARTRELYDPFHSRVSAIIADMAARNLKPVVVTMHSFSPVFLGQQRDVHLGVLHDEDPRLADAMLACTADWKDIIVRRNEPYGPQDSVCHSLNLHTRQRKLRGVMLEIRNDLIADEAGQAAWAARLADTFTRAVALQPHAV